MHFKEDTSKPENRVNITLFHILMIKELDVFLKRKLGLPESSVIYPSSNLIVDDISTPERPDYVIKSISGDPVGYIEVDLGLENKQQLENYREKQSLPVYSIVGKKCFNQGDLALDEIYEFILKVKLKYENTQSEKSIELFERLVKYYIIDGNFNDNKRTLISDQIRNSIIIKKLFDYFGSDRIIEGSKPIIGKILLNTISANGFSIRIYSRIANGNSLSIMSRRGGGHHIYFPSYKKLIKYFPNNQVMCKNYCDLIKNLGGTDIFDLKENEKAKLEIKILENNLAVLFSVVEKLM